MKESKIYWTVKRDIINLLLKTKGNSKPTIADIQQALITSNSTEKVNGIINNCLQKSTRRVPLERDPNPDIEVFRVKWSEMVAREFNGMASKVAREEEYD